MTAAWKIFARWMATTPRTPRVTVWSPVEDSPVLGQRSRALAQTRRSGRGNPRPLIRQARRASLLACRWASRFCGKSAPRIRHHAPFIRNASNPKQKNSFGPSRCRAAASFSVGREHMTDFFQRLLQGRYVGLLEAEVARLRTENRA